MTTLLSFQKIDIDLKTDGVSNPILVNPRLNASDTGAALLDCAIRAGLGEETFVHGVGDGAPWIASQIEQRFGVLSRYLLDFYVSAQ